MVCGWRQFGGDGKVWYEPGCQRHVIEETGEKCWRLWVWTGNSEPPDVNCWPKNYMRTVGSFEFLTDVIGHVEKHQEVNSDQGHS